MREGIMHKENVPKGEEEKSRQRELWLKEKALVGHNEERLGQSDSNGK